MNARFKLPTGLAVDDADKLFVSDSELKHVLVFTKDHKVEASISDGMVRPAGLAVDNENRFLYVADSERDQVLVYDADAPYKFLRAIGKPSGKHDLVEPGSSPGRPTLPSTRTAMSMLPTRSTTGSRSLMPTEISFANSASRAMVPDTSHGRRALRLIATDTFGWPMRFRTAFRLSPPKGGC